MLGAWMMVVGGSTKDFWSLTFKEYYQVVEASRNDDDTRHGPLFNDEEKKLLEEMKRKFA